MSQTRDYELVYIISPESSEQEIADLHTQIEQIVQRFSGTIEKSENWGRRKLAYEIRHQGEAFYHVVTFTTTPEALAEIERVLKITDEVLRHMATRQITRRTGPAEEPVPVA